jgi:NodT family efflux transporter outer membrane factor (OMF) lipoprotein
MKFHSFRLVKAQLGKAVAPALASLCMCACAVGPRYSRPATPVPPSYKEQEQPGWTVANPQDSALRKDWWTSFQDSPLNALEAQVQVSNQNIAAAMAQFQNAHAAVLASRSNLFPTITAAPSYTNSRQPTTGKRAINEISLPMEASWEPDLWGRVRSDIASNRANAQALAADAASVRLSMQAELASDYFQLRGADEAARALDQIVEQFQRSVELTQDRVRTGLAAQQDVLQAQTQLDGARVQRIDLGVQRAQLEHAIAVLIGKPPAEFSISVASFEPYLPIIPPGVPSQLLERRPDIAAAERRVEAANAEIGVAKAAFYPDVTLGVTAGLATTDLSQALSWPSRAWSIGPALAQTIFDKGRRRALTEEAVTAYDAAAANYRQTVLAAFQNVEDQLAAIRVLTNEAGAQDRALRDADGELDLTRSNYEAGTVSFLNVISAQTDLLNQRVASVNLTTRHINSIVLLIKALGGGWDVSQLPSAEQLQGKRASAKVADAKKTSASQTN